MVRAKRKLAFKKIWIEKCWGMCVELEQVKGGMEKMEEMWGTFGKGGEGEGEEEGVEGKDNESDIFIAKSIKKPSWQHTHTHEVKRLDESGRPEAIGCSTRKDGIGWANDEGEG